MWFNLTALEKLAKEGKHPSACPRFIEVFSEEGCSVDMNKGLPEMYAMK